jgi:hypothetical protein
VVAVEQEVMVGPGDVDPAGADPLAVLGEGSRKWARGIEDVGEMARCVGRDMEDDEDGGGEALGKPGDERPEGLDAAGGRADDDDRKSMMHRGLRE